MLNLFKKYTEDYNKRYEKSPLFRGAVWFLGIYGAFLVGSLTHYIHHIQKENQHGFENASAQMKKNIEDVFSVMSFIDQRLSHATDQSVEMKILQDRYVLNFGKSIPPNLLTIHHIKDVKSKTSLGPLGIVNLDYLPSQIFFEQLFSSDKKITALVRGNSFYFFFPRRFGPSHRGSKPVLMLSVPLADFLPNGVFLESGDINSRVLWASELGRSFFYENPSTLSLTIYLHSYAYSHLGLMLLTLLFWLFSRSNLGAIKKENSSSYENQIETLSNLSVARSNEVETLSAQIEDNKLNDFATKRAEAARNELLGSYGNDLSRIEERTLKKLDILSSDLAKFSREDESFKSLSEVCRTVLDDFQVLTFKSLQNSVRVKFDLEDVIESALQVYASDIYRKDLTYQVSMELKSIEVFGDRNALAIILTNLIKIAVDRLSSKGKLKISACELDSFADRAIITISDNGYHFDDADLSHYAANPKLKSELLNLPWKNLEGLILQYGGQIIEKTNSAKENIISIALPVGHTSAINTNQADNVIPLFSKQT